MNTKSNEKQLAQIISFPISNYKYLKIESMIFRQEIWQIVSKNNICLLPTYKNQMLIVHLYAKNSSIKITKKNNIHHLNIIFMNKSNSFIVQTMESIQVWNLKRFFNWENDKTILEQHINPITAITLDKSDTFIVSAQKDGMIKFWNQAIDWKCQQLIQSSLRLIQQLKLNDSGGTLIIVDQQNLCLINLQENGIWYEQRKISGQYDYLCFLENDLFAYVSHSFPTGWQINFSEAGQTNQILCLQSLLGQSSTINKLLYIKSMNFLLLIVSDSLIHVNRKNQGEFFVAEQFDSEFIDLSNVITISTQNTELLLIKQKSIQKPSKLLLRKLYQI